MTTNTITGTYGGNNTPCTIYTYESGSITWYCVDGSVNVNATHETLEDGCNVELVEDCDTSTSNEPIESEEELETFIDPPEKVQRFVIDIDDFNDSAMCEDPQGETIRILKGIIANIENNGLWNCDTLRLKDINGNNVGSVEVEVY